MKLTLAFDIYNKERWLVSLLDSWLSNLSGKNEYEFIVVFDDLHDKSKQIADERFKNYGYSYLSLSADDKYEIFCNNLALQHATGDYIIFIQDDNWIYDKNWDLLLCQVVDRVQNLGAVGLLAGLKLSAPLKWVRVEIDRPHKEIHFTKLGKLESYELGVWEVDAINRPFCVSTNLLRGKKGLDKEFMPTTGDDLDLSLKFKMDNRINIYIPFDLVNITTYKEQFSKKDFFLECHRQCNKLCRKRYENYLTNRKDQRIQKLFDLKEIQNSLELIHE